MASTTTDFFFPALPCRPENPLSQEHDLLVAAATTALVLDHEPMDRLLFRLVLEEFGYAAAT